MHSFSQKRYNHMRSNNSSLLNDHRRSRSPMHTSTLDPDLESKVNKIINKIPGYIKQSVTERHRQYDYPSPSQQSPTYSTASRPYDSTNESYTRASRSLYKSTSPIKPYQESLNRRMEEALNRSRQFTQNRSKSPNRRFSPLRSSVTSSDANLINQRVEQALRRSQTNLKRSGDYSAPHQTSLRRSGDYSAPHTNGYSSQYTSPTDQHLKNYLPSTLKSEYGIHASPLSQRNLEPYTSLSDSRYLPSSQIFPTTREFSSAKKSNGSIDYIFQETMNRSHAALKRNEEFSRSSHYSHSRPESNRRPSEDNYRASANISSLKSSFAQDRPIVSSTTPSKEGKNLYIFSNAVMNLSPAGVYVPTSAQKAKNVEENYENGTSYKGEKLRGKRQGRGVYTYEDGSKYDGEWDNDLRSGYGVKYFVNDEVEYEGEWLDDKYSGTGNLNNQKPRRLEESCSHQDFSAIDGAWERYEGEFELGKWHGLGTLYLSNDEKFVGKFKYGEVNGTGTFYPKDKSNITGEWKNNRFVGSL